MSGIGLRTDTGTASAPLLQVDDLHVVFETEGGEVNAVNALSYEVHAGEIVAILGESGSGKSVGARSIMQLIPRPPGRITRGRILFKGRNLLELPEVEVRRLCGQRIALVPQDPLSAFNPLFPIGWQIAEVFRVHQGISTRQAREAVIHLMKRVQISAAEARFDDYPFQFSGGMRQRALIAMALALSPELLIADEPTTALDVTTQAQILELLVELQADFGMGLILITHDIGVVAEITDRVVVMYAGRIAETGSTDTVLRQPAHPYTKGLRDSLPDLDARQERLVSIPGTPPDLSRIPPGCPFHPRCAWSKPGLCDQALPPLRTLAGRQVACHLAEQVLLAGSEVAG